MRPEDVPPAIRSLIEKYGLHMHEVGRAAGRGATTAERVARVQAEQAWVGALSEIADEIERARRTAAASQK